MDRMETDALALGEALAAGEASDFFSFAEILRGEQTARATTQTLLIIADLFFIGWISYVWNGAAACKTKTGRCGFSSWSNESSTGLQPWNHIRGE
jgi:hypothetical protein